MSDPKKSEWEVFLEEEARREQELLDEECGMVPDFLSISREVDEDGFEIDDSDARDMARDRMDDVLRRMTGLDG
jgi:hypothetical protein